MGWLKERQMRSEGKYCKGCAHYENDPSCPKGSEHWCRCPLIPVSVVGERMLMKCEANYATRQCRFEELGGADV